MLALPTLQASDLLAMLRRHYLPDGRPPGGILAAEIGAPGSERRADAIWAPWTVAAGAGLAGHEIKVTRADVIVELADPMKAEPWARYCSRWWLVIPRPDLIAGLEVPAAWGVMAPPSGRRTRTMTVLREAPQLKPVDTGPAWRRIATWDHHRLEERLREATWQAESTRRDLERVKSDLLERQLAGEGRQSPHGVSIGKVLAALEQRRWTPVPIDADLVAEAIHNLQATRDLTRRARREIEWMAGEAQRLASPLADVARELERLSKAEAPA